MNNQKTRVITPEEEAMLIANAEEPLRSLIQIALLTGLRLNSIRTLKCTRVDFNTNTILIEATNSKNKRPYPYERYSQEDTFRSKAEMWGVR